MDIFIFPGGSIASAQDMRDEFHDEVRDASTEVYISGMEFDPVEVLRVMAPKRYRPMWNDWVRRQVEDNGMEVYYAGHPFEVCDACEGPRLFHTDEAGHEFDDSRY